MEFWKQDRSKTGQIRYSHAIGRHLMEKGQLDKCNQENEDYALMACNSSDSDTEVISCSNKCKESYANLKKLYDAQREQLSDASIEIKAYSQGLKKVEAQLVAHQQGQLWSNAPIIEGKETDSEDECVSIPTKQQETPSFANKQVKTPRETVKNQFTHIQKPKVNKKDLGHGLTTIEAQRKPPSCSTSEDSNGSHKQILLLLKLVRYLLSNQTDLSPRPSPTPIIPDSIPATSVKQRFPSKSFLKKHRVHKESVSKQGRKAAKGESSVQRDPLFDTIPEDTADHMETENA
ncbi:hypothetical protein Tco_0152849 [Tanacetum coccineum]